MKKYTLIEKLHWNAVKHQELADGFVVSSKSATQIAQSLKVKSHNIFQEKLHFRAKYLDDNQFIKQALSQVRQSILFGVIALIVLAFVFGWVSTSVILNTQDKQNTINFYGVLIALLGANTVALFFWLMLLCFKNVFSPIQGILKLFIQHLTTLKQKHWSASKKPHAQSDKKTSNAHVFSAVQSWHEFLFHSSAGRWCMSTLLHTAWAVFLLSALACVLYKLSIEHYQFVWESTLLSSDTFVWLTQKISILPNALGLPTPSIEQIQQSQLQGVMPHQVNTETATANTSRAWAILLMGALFIYGIAPRLILVLICSILAYVWRQKWLPNFNEPYYQKLILALTPSSLDTTVIDKDITITTITKQHHTNDLNHAKEKQHLTQWLSRDPIWSCASLEVHLPPQHWTPNQWGGCIDLGELNNRHSIQQALALINKKNNTLVLCDLNAVPDRGMQRVLAKIKNNSKELALALLVTDNFNTSRFEQWAELAQHIQIAHTLVVNEAMDIIQS